MMAINIANVFAENGLESHLCATRQEGDLKVKIGSEVHYVFMDKKSPLDVLSSNSEGLPLALLEYGLSKLPVVLTDMRECGTVVNNLESGMVIPLNNENKMAEGIIFLIEKDKQRKVFGENLYKNTVLNYGKNTYLTQLIPIYNFE